MTNPTHYRTQVDTYLKSKSLNTNPIFYYIDADTASSIGINEQNLKLFSAYPSGGSDLFQILNLVDDTLKEKIVFIGQKEDFLPAPKFEKLKLCKFNYRY